MRKKYEDICSLRFKVFALQSTQLYRSVVLGDKYGVIKSVVRLNESWNMLTKWSLLTSLRRVSRLDRGSVATISEMEKTRTCGHILRFSTISWIKFTLGRSSALENELCEIDPQIPSGVRTLIALERRTFSPFHFALRMSGVQEVIPMLPS